MPPTFRSSDRAKTLVHEQHGPGLGGKLVAALAQGTNPGVIQQVDFDFLRSLVAVMVDGAFALAEYQYYRLVGKSSRRYERWTDFDNSGEGQARFFLQFALGILHSIGLAQPGRESVLIVVEGNAKLTEDHKAALALLVDVDGYDDNGIGLE